MSKSFIAGVSLSNIQLSVVISMFKRWYSPANIHRKHILYAQKWAFTHLGAELLRHGIINSMLSTTMIYSSKVTNLHFVIKEKKQHIVLHTSIYIQIKLSPKNQNWNLWLWDNFWIQFSLNCFSFFFSPWQLFKFLASHSYHGHLLNVLAHTHQKCTRTIIFKWNVVTFLYARPGVNLALKCHFT